LFYVHKFSYNSNLINLTETSFLEKKKAKKHALSTPNDNFKDNFQQLRYQRIFGDWKLTRSRTKVRSARATPCRLSASPRENEQRLKRKSLQDFPKLISQPARKLAGEINFL